MISLTSRLISLAYSRATVCLSSSTLFIFCRSDCMNDCYHIRCLFLYKHFQTEMKVSVNAWLPGSHWVVLQHAGFVCYVYQEGMRNDFPWDLSCLCARNTQVCLTGHHGANSIITAWLACQEISNQVPPFLRNCGRKRKKLLRCLLSFLGYVSSYKRRKELYKLSTLDALFEWYGSSFPVLYHHGETIDYPLIISWTKNLVLNRSETNLKWSWRLSKNGCWVSGVQHAFIRPCFQRTVYFLFPAGLRRGGVGGKGQVPLEEMWSDQLLPWTTALSRCPKPRRM